MFVFNKLYIYKYLLYEKRSFFSLSTILWVSSQYGIETISVCTSKLNMNAIAACRCLFIFISSFHAKVLQCMKTYSQSIRKSFYLYLQNMKVKRFWNLSFWCIYYDWFTSESSLWITWVFSYTNLLIKMKNDTKRSVKIINNSYILNNILMKWIAN